MHMHTEQDTHQFLNCIFNWFFMYVFINYRYGERVWEKDIL